MKYFLIAIVMGIHIAGRAQSDSVTSSISIAVFRQLYIPVDISLDSCYYTQFMMKVTVNAKGKVGGMEVSDNSASWVKTEFQNALPRFDTARINSYLKKENIRSLVIVMPMVIHAVTFPCKEVFRKELLPKKDLYLFSGKPLTGKLVFTDAVVITLYPADHRPKRE